MKVVVAVIGCVVAICILIAVMTWARGENEEGRVVAHPPEGCHGHGGVKAERSLYDTYGRLYPAEGNGVLVFVCTDGTFVTISEENRDAPAPSDDDVPLP